LGHLRALGAIGCRQRWQISPDGRSAAFSIGPAHNIASGGKAGCRRL
jgi:hypothetical protein